MINLNSNIVPKLNKVNNTIVSKLVDSSALPLTQNINACAQTDGFSKTLRIENAFNTKTGISYRHPLLTDIRIYFITGELRYLSESGIYVPKGLAAIVKDSPDVALDILTRLENEIVDKIDNCRTTKIDWDSLTAVCEDLLKDMVAQGISSDNDACRKVMALKDQAIEQNIILDRVGSELIAHTRTMSSWIDRQRIIVKNLEVKTEREQIFAELQSRAARMVGDVENLKDKFEVAAALEAERLTAGIVATLELLKRVDALTAADAYLALPMIQDLSKADQNDLQERVAAMRPRFYNRGFYYVFAIPDVW